MELHISNKILATDIPERMVKEIAAGLTMRNPVYSDNEKRGRWNGGTEEFIFCYEKGRAGEIIIPRGYCGQLFTMAKQYGEPVKWTDGTRHCEPVDFEFSGVLRNYQKEAARAILRRRSGVFECPTGGGKTIIGLFVIAQRKQPALIIVHTLEIMHQWIDRIHSFLDIPVDEIGIIGGGKMRIGDRITVGMVQTLHKVKEDVVEYIGHVVVDECHRCPSRTFTEAVTAFDSRFMLGLSATPFRRDKLTKLIYLHLGDRVHSVSQAELTQTGAILPFRVKWVKTAFETYRNPSLEYSAVLSELTRDRKRNALVSSEAAQYANSGGGIPLIVSDRKEHCRALREAMMDNHGIDADILTGDLSGKDRSAVIEKIHAGACQALIATGALVGEGIDLPSLGAVLLSTPIRFEGRVIQSVGRALRPSPGQDYATVIDFVDIHVGALEASARKRQAVYLSMGA